MIAIFEADKACQETFAELQEVEFFEEDINTALTKPKPYEAISIFIRSHITKEVLELLPNLRYIQTRSTGVDHIDLEACKARGIIVSNVKGYAGPAVGEFAFSLLLDISRKTCTAIERTKKGNFFYKDLLGFELNKKRLGIVGLGTIGRVMARIGYGFGMEILGYTRHYDEAFCERFDIKKVSFDELLSQSDVIMLAVPLTPQTRHLINQNNVGRIKDGAVLINVARGEIIEKEALFALQKRGITLGLDVIEDEKALFAQKPEEFLSFLQSPNLLHTPHMAYYTKEALARIRSISLQNLRNFLEHKAIEFRVV